MVSLLRINSLSSELTHLIFICDEKIIIFIFYLLYKYFPHLKDYRIKDTNYMLKGKGKESNPVQDAFEKLDYNFIAIQLDPMHKGKQ